MWYIVMKLIGRQKWPQPFVGKQIYVTKLVEHWHIFNYSAHCQPTMVCIYRYENYRLYYHSLLEDPA